jgi:hypothetical protein
VIVRALPLLWAAPGFVGQAVFEVGVIFDAAASSPTVRITIECCPPILPILVLVVTLAAAAALLRRSLQVVGGKRVGFDVVPLPDELVGTIRGVATLTHDHEVSFAAVWDPSRSEEAAARENGESALSAEGLSP